jgi:DNA-binding winged helix-turn-helix (wHTH) protein/Tol biopolymer transport system component
MDKKLKPLYEFGPFQLDTDERLLLRAGEVVSLTPKAFDLLLVLVEQPGHLLEKETLLKAVWPDSFVEENNLADNISKLRKALNDGENGQKFIETLPKRGYRFLAEVREQNGSSAASAVTQLPTTPTLTVVNGAATPSEQVAAALPFSEKSAKNALSRGRNNTLRRRSLLVCGVLIIAAAIPIYLSLKSRWQIPKVTRYTQVTSDGRSKRDAVVTDGARVYFSEQLGGQIVLAQVSSVSGETVPFQPQLSNANLLAISPDRSKLLIGRFEASAPECPLWVVPVTGGSPYRLGDVLAHAATWTADGEWITYANGGDLFQVMNDGSGTRKLLGVTGRIQWPRWSPDGNRVRFTVLDAKTMLPKLWEAAADGANPHPLLPDWNTPEGECCGNWSADGKYFVFESVRNRVSDIWVLSEDSGLFARARPEPVRLTFGPMNFHAPVLSADGSRIFVIGKQHRGELIRYDAKIQQFVRHLSGLSAEGLNFSTDGEWVSYMTYPEGDLWRSKVDGSQRLQLSFSPLRARNARWSPDGKRLAFQAQLPGKPWKIYLVSKDGGSPQQLMTKEQEESGPCWSPDGNSLLFDARTTAPRMRALYLLDLRKNQVSPLPGGMKMFAPRWSPDGRYIVAQPLDSQKIMLFDFTTQEWGELVQGPAGTLTWSRDSKYVYFTVQFGNEPGIKRARISDRKVEWVADLKELRLVQTYFGSWFGLAPDDSPLVLRDIGIQDIYALDWKAP